jgi:ABC-type maltose transport system permease subunit
MFGWFAVVILALIVPALILFATFKFCRPLITVMFASAELKVPALTVPVTVRSIVLISHSLLGP